MSLINNTLDKLFGNTDNIVKIKNAFDPPANPSKLPRMQPDNETRTAGFSSTGLMLGVAGVGLLAIIALRKK